MSWNFSQALVEEFSDRGFSDTAQSAQLKKIRTAGRSSFDGKRRATWNPFPYGTTSEHSMADRGVASWISSRQDSRANHGVRQEPEKALMTNETSGQTQRASFARWDPGTRSWRTSQDFLGATISARSSETWQRQGSMRNGELYPRLPLVPRTAENGSGYWPTPASTDWKRNGKEEAVARGHSPNLPEVVGGKLNPDWTEWLLGWPIGWTGSKPLGTDRFQRWLDAHGNCSVDIPAGQE